MKRHGFDTNLILSITLTAKRDRSLSKVRVVGIKSLDKYLVHKLPHDQLLGLHPPLCESGLRRLRHAQDIQGSRNPQYKSIPAERSKV